MTRWSDGYVTDISYTSGFYRELTPAWISLAALLGGQLPPDLARPFRWAELGCGNGMTTNCVAAMHPNAEAWGFDFNPAHIDNCQRLATAAGLANARFRETSFADIACDDSLPMFDFIVIHGVLSWIGPDVQRDVMTFIDRHLAPGGLAYVSYNTPTGWDAMAPLQFLMRQIASGMNGRSDQIMPAILDQIDGLVEANALFFRRNPEMVNRLKRLRTMDVRYVAHEYLNQHWRPMMFAEVAAAMAGAKCDFVASATLADNLDYASVPLSVLPLLTNARDRHLREALRDFGSAQAFRRDVFRRGQAHVTVAQQYVFLQDFRIVPIAPRAAGEFRFNTSQGEMLGNADLYDPILERLYANGGISLPEIRTLPGSRDRSPAQIAETMTLVVHAGLAHPALPEAVAAQARESCAAFNRAVTQLNLAGADYGMLCSPVTGTALGAELLETFCRQHLGTAAPEAGALTATMEAALRATDRNLLKDGKPVTGPAEEAALLAEAATRLTGTSWQVRRALGLYD